MAKGRGRSSANGRPGRSPSVRALKEQLSAKGVKYCFSSYVDVHGVPKGKTVPIEHFDRMMRGSELFTGAALEGLGQGPQDDELAAHPDPGAVTQLPWEPEVAWCPGNLRYHDEPWPMCSRTVLCRQVERAARMGLKLNLGIECEVFVLRREGGRIYPNHDRDDLAKAAYDFAGTLLNHEFLDEVVAAMNALGWDVHSFDHEDANGQFEFDFAYSDVLTMADRFVLWRLLMKEMARRRGWEATFMPKPFPNRTGSGAHFNMSIADLETGRNISGDAADPRGCGLSATAYHFLGGLMKHAAALVATTCPTVNSYKRLIKTGSMTGFTWAPIYISYGGNNRTHMFRVPLVRPDIEGSKAARKGDDLSGARCECRAVDPAMNPYLAAAMALGAGLDGIENQIDPGDPIDRNMYLLSDQQRRRLGVKALPRTLLEAIEAFAKDSLSRRVMGEDLFSSYVELKTQEWWNYHDGVSQWEIDEYLTKF